MKIAKQSKIDGLNIANHEEINDYIMSVRQHIQKTLDVEKTLHRLRDQARAIEVIALTSNDENIAEARKTLFIATKLAESEKVAELAERLRSNREDKQDQSLYSSPVTAGSSISTTFNNQIKIEKLLVDEITLPDGDSSITIDDLDMLVDEITDRINDLQKVTEEK